MSMDLIIQIQYVPDVIWDFLWQCLTSSGQQEHCRMHRLVEFSFINSRENGLG